VNEKKPSHLVRLAKWQIAILILMRRKSSPYLGIHHVVGQGDVGDLGVVGKGMVGDWMVRQAQSEVILDWEFIAEFMLSYIHNLRHLPMAKMPLQNLICHIGDIAH
jgi:hypothetical protein